AARGGDRRARGAAPQDALRRRVVRAARLRLFAERREALRLERRIRERQLVRREPRRRIPAAHGRLPVIRPAAPPAPRPRPPPARPAPSAGTARAAPR